MTKFLVTGKNGLLGSAICRMLKSRKLEFDVLILNSNKESGFRTFNFEFLIYTTYLSCGTLV